jgi:hypothetical protein
LRSISVSVDVATLHSSLSIPPCIRVPRLRLVTQYSMSGSPNDPLPDLFSTEGPPSPAGLAAGSESQGPGGGNPAAGVNLAANTSPHHTNITHPRAKVRYIPNTGLHASGRQKCTSTHRERSIQSSPSLSSESTSRSSKAKVSPPNPLRMHGTPCTRVTGRDRSGPRPQLQAPTPFSSSD